MEHKFNIGDTVKILDGSKIDGYTGGFNGIMRVHCGETSKIRNVTDKGGKPCYYLENLPFVWDERGLKRVNEERKIVITVTDRTTRAALYDGHKLIKETKAKCHKDDEFTFVTGAKIAFERLTAKPAEPKPIDGIFYNMNDVHEYFNGSFSTKYNAVGEALNGYTKVKQIKVMEVKEG